MLCKRVVTKDRRYITQITCYEKGQNGKANLGKPISRTPMRMPLFGKQGGGVLSSLFSKIGRQGEVSALLRIAETQFLREFQTMIGMILNVYTHSPGGKIRVKDRQNLCKSLQF